MIATNPATASWLRELNLDVSGLWISLMLLLAIPMSAGLWIAHQFPKLNAKIQTPPANFSLIVLLAFIVLATVKERQLLTFGLLPTLAIVVVHNASRLFWLDHQRGDGRYRARPPRRDDRRRYAKRRPRARHHRAAIQRRPRHGHDRKLMGHLAHHQRPKPRDLVATEGCTPRIMNPRHKKAPTDEASSLFDGFL